MNVNLPGSLLFYSCYQIIPDGQGLQTKTWNLERPFQNFRISRPSPSWPFSDLLAKGYVELTLSTMALIQVLLLLIVANATRVRAEDRSFLDGGESLEPFQHLDSGYYQLQMDSITCTLKLWKGYGDGVVWESSGGALVTSEDISVCKLTLQKNGKLVISSPNKPIIWQSSVSLLSDANCRLEVRNVLNKLGTAVVVCLPIARLQPDLPVWSAGVPLWSTGFW